MGLNILKHQINSGTMNVTLTPAQQNFIQAKISTGKYKSTRQVIEIAL